MISRLSHITFLTLTFISTILLMHTSGAEDINQAQLAVLLKKYQNLAHLESQFTQTKVLKDLGVEIKSSGRLKVSHTGLIEWAIQTPAPLRVLFAKDEVKIETGEGSEKKLQTIRLNEIGSNKEVQNINELMTWLSLDAQKISARYAVKKLENLKYEFRPKNVKQHPFQKLTLLMKANGLVDEVQMSESSGDEINIKMDQPKITYMAKKK